MQTAKEEHGFSLPDTWEMQTVKEEYGFSDKIHRKLKELWKNIGSQVTLGIVRECRGIWWNLGKCIGM